MKVGNKTTFSVFGSSKMLRGTVHSLFTSVDGSKWALIEADDKYNNGSFYAKSMEGWETVVVRGMRNNEQQQQQQDQSPCTCNMLDLLSIGHATSCPHKK